VSEYEALPFFHGRPLWAARVTPHRGFQDDYPYANSTRTYYETEFLYYLAHSSALPAVSPVSIRADEYSEP
ncbi:MAG: hypothetical protein WD205_00610, partial [Rhodothermales bacterium]